MNTSNALTEDSLYAVKPLTGKDINQDISDLE